MKRFLLAAGLALGLALSSQQQAHAWINSRFAIGFNWQFQFESEGWLYRLFCHCPPPCPLQIGPLHCGGAISSHFGVGHAFNHYAAAAPGPGYAVAAYGQPEAFGQAVYAQQPHAQQPYAPQSYGQQPYAPQAYGWSGNANVYQAVSYPGQANGAYYYQAPSYWYGR